MTLINKYEFCNQIGDWNTQTGDKPNLQLSNCYTYLK